MNEIVITFNSKRLIFSIFIFLLFGFLGLFFFLRAEELIDVWIIKNSTFFQISGIFILVISIVMAVLIFKLLFRKIGLVIDGAGFENSSSVGGESGKVSWDEVSDIRNGDTVVLVYLIDPACFISSKRNFFNKQSLKMNYKNYGTPIAINMFALNSYVDTLERQLKEQWEEYKKTKNTIVES